MDKESRIEIDVLEHAINLFGKFDENIKIIEQAFHVHIVNRENEIRITSAENSKNDDADENLNLATKVVLDLLETAKRNDTQMMVCTSDLELSTGEILLYVSFWKRFWKSQVRQ